MNISEMSGQEKSVALMKAAGWFSDEAAEPWTEWEQNHLYHQAFAPNSTGVDLYHPANMALAWRVRVEITEYRLTTTYGKWNKWRMRAKDWLDEPDAATVIRLWLDKLLALAIEARLVEVTHV